MFKDGDVILLSDKKEFRIDSSLSNIYIKKYGYSDPHIKVDEWYWGEYLNSKDDYTFNHPGRLSGWKKEWADRCSTLIRNESVEVDMDDWL